MGRVVFGLYVALIATNCATTQNNKQQSDQDVVQSTKDNGEQQSEEENNESIKNKKVLVCKEVKPTGSHIPRKICRWKSQVKERELQDQEKMRQMMRGGGGGPKGE
ncbi:MAG: hypothetical protein GY847_05360 [Proteobacteria bacterium]|nr:hypothetical protein [Pseudomonadota bacterium]